MTTANRKCGAVAGAAAPGLQGAGVGGEALQVSGERTLGSNSRSKDTLLKNSVSLLTGTLDFSPPTKMGIAIVTYNALLVPPELLLNVTTDSVKNTVRTPWQNRAATRQEKSK
jgi:hypothetical protein